MKLYQPFTRWGYLAILSVATTITLLAFTGGPGQPPRQSKATDTIPKKNKAADERDLDKELRQLDQAKENLGNLKDKDWDNIQRTVEETIKRVDVEKIQQQTMAALAKVDYDKINRQVQEALRRIDFDKIQSTIDEALSEAKKVDREEVKRELEKAKQEVKEAMAKEDWKADLKRAQEEGRGEAMKALAEAKKEIARAREELQHNKVDFKKEMEKAGVEVDKAKAELKSYQEMIYEMEKDGLLSTKEDYSIEYSDGELTVNGKKQPATVTDKYKKYFHKKTIAIKKRDGHIDINNHL